MAQSPEKLYLFEEAPIPTAVAKLAIPTVMSMLVMVIYNLADTYFVGMLNDPIQNAGVTLAAPVLLAFNAINNLFGVGSSSLMSRSMGAKRYNKVYQSSATGFYCALLCAALFAVGCTVFQEPLLGLLGVDDSTCAATASYMHWTVTMGAVPAILNVFMAYVFRAEGAAAHASVGTMSGCILNMILDPIFILPWGLNMGVEGAGLATFLSNCFACCYFLVLLLVRRGKTFVSIHPKNITFQKSILLGIFAVGVPAAIQNLLNVTGMTLLNNLTASYGAEAVAAMGIAYRNYNVAFYVTLGISQGVMPLVSYTYAAKKAKRMKDTILFTLRFSLVIICILAVCNLLFAPQMIGIFMEDATVIGYGTVFLRTFTFGLPFLSIDFIGVGVYQATGKGTIALFFAILRKIILEIPAILIWNTLIPLYGLAAAQGTAEVILAVVAILVLRRLFRQVELEAEQESKREELC